MSKYNSVPVTPPAMGNMQFRGCEHPPEVHIERSFAERTPSLEMNKMHLQGFRQTPKGHEMFNRQMQVSSYAARGVFKSTGNSVVNSNSRGLSSSGSAQDLSMRKESALKQLSRSNSARSVKSKAREHKFPLGAFSLQPYATAYHKEEEQRIINYFNGVFRDLDDDGSGEITKKEFHSAFKRPDMQREFQKLGFQFHESPKLFKYLNKDLGPTLDIYEFVDGLREIVDQNNKNGTPGRIVQPKFPGGPAPMAHVFRNCYCCDRDPHVHWV